MSSLIVRPVKTSEIAKTGSMVVTPDKYGIIAKGPWVKPSGMLKHRIVLRVVQNLNTDEIIEFVIHTQGQYEDGKHAGFSNGSYFPVHRYGKGGSAIMSAVEDALKRFVERVKEKCLDLDFDCLFREIEVIAS